MNINVTCPVGLKEGVEAIQNICKYSHMYHGCGLKPPHYIVNLDAGNGQTTFTEFVTKAFRNTKVRHFGGLDHYLEFTLNGSLNQLKDVFAEIRSCAVYTNDFEGVIAMDIAKLAAYVGEFQVEYFLNEVEKMSQHATFIFYTPSAANRNMMSLIKKLVEVLNEVQILNVSPYSHEEILQIVKDMLEEKGVMLEDSSENDSMILKVIVEEEITNVKRAKKLAQRMIKMADFQGFVPKLTAKEIQGIVLYKESLKKEAKKYEK